MTDGKTPWLEPGAGIAGENAAAIPSEQVRLAATLSIAITFKRAVDLLEPFLKMAADQLQQELSESKKGKGHDGR